MHVYLFGQSAGELNAMKPLKKVLMSAVADWYWPLDNHCKNRQWYG